MQRLLIALTIALSVSPIHSVAVGQVTTDVRLASVTFLTGITLNPVSVIGGSVSTGTITLNKAAGSSGVTVKLESSAPAIAAVPTSATVQPGLTSANFMVQTYRVAGNPNVVTDPPSVQISGSIGTSAAKTVSLTVKPATLATFTVSPASLAGGAAASGTVTVTGPAASGGLTIALSNATTSATASASSRDLSTRMQAPPVTLPEKVTVLAGATTATFSIGTKAVASPTPVQLIASYGPFISRSATLTLLPPALASLTTNPAPNAGGVVVVQGGQSATVTVNLTAPAPAEGMSFPITISPNSCPTCISPCGPAPSAPATAQIAGGSTSVVITVTTSPGRGFHHVNVSDKRATVYVQDAVFTAESLELPSTVKGGTLVNARIKLTGTVSACGLGGHYKLKSSNTSLAALPPEVTIPPGSSEGSFSFVTTAVPTTQTVEISVWVHYNNNSLTEWYKKILTLTP